MQQLWLAYRQRLNLVFCTSVQHLPLEQAKILFSSSLSHAKCPSLSYSRVFVGGGLSYLPELSCPKPMP